MPRTRKTRRKPGRPPAHPHTSVERAILAAYIDGADARDIERAHTEAKLAYVRSRLDLRIPKRMLK